MQQCSTHVFDTCKKVLNTLFYNEHDFALEKMQFLKYSKPNVIISEGDDTWFSIQLQVTTQFSEFWNTFLTVCTKQAKLNDQNEIVGTLKKLQTMSPDLLHSENYWATH